ncbi:MAG: protein-export chaperone SecB [Rhodanobacter sp.]|jgi:preprotein translocase subunit SecB|nr:protein-export chaperone SecB [Rhodanobacter sp.]
MAELSNGAANGQAHPQQDQAQLSLQRIYIKDVSFEAPGAPHIFQQQGQPNVELNLSQRVAQLSNDAFEVVLSVTATCKLEDKTMYLAEVHQAGIFGLSGFDAQGREAVLATYCPNVLFPYARQMVSDLVQSGGFPPFFLQPINFDALYAEQVRRRKETGAGAPANV